MKLADWLAATHTKRIDFARRIGVSPASITALCNEEAAWISREMAERIAAATDNSVTPNDFLGLAGTLTATTGTARDERAEGRELTMKDVNARVRTAIDAFAKGEIVIVTDDDDRENEGDLIIAAVHCTTEKMAFIIRNTCGIVCAPVTAAEARRLNLQPMVASNDAPLGTAFTVSVDVKHGLTTGISAEQRANTVRGLANGNMGAGDFVRPGHVFPLIAKDGGVLMRSGHTEAAVDLCKLASLPPVGVICELANDDGTVMKGPQIAAFADKHALKRLSVADLIAYRQAREKLVERVATFQVETPVGPVTGHAYVTPFDPFQHFAFVFGDLGEGLDIPARLHRADVLADVLGGAGSIQAALRHFKETGRGVLVYLRDGSAGVPLNAVGRDETSESQRAAAWREIGLGAQILKDLGVSSIRNLTTGSSRAYVGLSGFGIEIAGTDPLAKG